MMYTDAMTDRRPLANAARTIPLQDRIIPEPNSGCHLWEGAVTTAGYGLVGRNGKLIYVYRLVWEKTNGPIPAGLHVLHRCDVPCCVNVEHLFLGTHYDNMRDMAAKGRANGGGAFNSAKLVCKRGHPFDEANTRWDNGKRQCRQCDLIRWRAAYWRGKRDEQ